MKKVGKDNKGDNYFDSHVRLSKDKSTLSPYDSRRYVYSWELTSALKIFSRVSVDGLVTHLSIREMVCILISASFARSACESPTSIRRAFIDCARFFVEIIIIRFFLCGQIFS